MKDRLDQQVSISRLFSHLIASESHYGVVAQPGADGDSDHEIVVLSTVRDVEEDRKEDDLKRYCRNLSIEFGPKTDLTAMAQS